MSSTVESSAVLQKSFGWPKWVLVVLLIFSSGCRAPGSKQSSRFQSSEHFWRSILSSVNSNFGSIYPEWNLDCSSNYIEKAINRWRLWFRPNLCYSSSSNSSNSSFSPYSPWSKARSSSSSVILLEQQDKYPPNYMIVQLLLARSPKIMAVPTFICTIHTHAHTQYKRVNVVFVLVYFVLAAIDVCRHNVPNTTGT